MEMIKRIKIVLIAAILYIGFILLVIPTIVVAVLVYISTGNGRLFDSFIEWYFEVINDNL